VASCSSGVTYDIRRVGVVFKAANDVECARESLIYCLSGVMYGVRYVKASSAYCVIYGAKFVEAAYCVCGVKCIYCSSMFRTSSCKILGKYVSIGY